MSYFLSIFFYLGPPNLIKKLKDSEIIEGHVSEFTVQTNSCFPFAQANWYLNETQIFPDEKFTIESKDFQHRLLISDMQESLNGDLKCVISNDLGSVESQCKVVTIVPPKFIKKLEDNISNMNEEFKWAFELRSYPKAELKIFKDNKEIKPSDKLSIQKTDKDHLFEVIFKKVEAADQGLYKIVASNKGGSDESQAQFTVSGVPKFTKKPNSELSVAEKKQIKTEFECTGLPLPEIQWFKDGEPLAANQRVKLDTRLKTIHSITIDNANLSDFGTYTLKAKNQYGEISESFNLTVQTGPVFTKNLDSNIEVTENDECLLEFSTTGIPVPNVIWSKDRSALSESERVKFVTISEKSNENIYKLIIENIKLEDAGVYSAKVKNNLGEVIANTKLNVLFAPKLNKELNSEYNVKEHDASKFSVEVTANPKAEILWSKSNEPISSSDRYKLESQQNNHSLVIKDTLISDSGNFVCIAQNKVGKIVSSTNLNVSIPPKFTQAPELNNQVNLGQNVTFKCITRGLPLPEVKFLELKDQKEIVTDQNIDLKSVILSETEIENSLEIKSVSDDTCQSFEIKAKNPSGEANSKFNLIVHRGPQFEKEISEMELNEASDLIFEIIVHANPDAILTWFKDGNKINASKRIQIVEVKDENLKKQNKKKFNFKIAAVNKDDAGFYEVTAVNKLGEAKSSGMVKVNFGPVIIKDLKSKEKQTQGNSFTFECTVRSNPIPQVKWYFMDKEIENGSDYEIINEGDVFKLNIGNLRSDMAGAYKLIATNPVGTVQSSVCNLEIDVLPVIKALFDSDVIIEEEGKLIEALFEITGKPDPTVEYFKDETKFKPTEKRVTLSKTDKIYKLTIPDVKVADAGVYKISAKNPAGQISLNITLKIKSAPKLVKSLKNKIEVIEDSKLDLVTSIAPGVYPDPEFKWFKNDEELIESEGVVVLKDGFSNTVLIDNVQMNNNGDKYKFRCENELGSCESEAVLDVFSKPKFLLDLVNCEPDLNQAFELPFEVDCNPEPKIKVIKNDKEVRFDKRLQLIKELEERNFRKIYKYKLVFASAVADDTGLYKVEVVNKVGDAKSQAQLTVKGSACFIRKPADVSVVLNKPVKVECEISGIPTPDCVWFKDGQKVVQNDRVKIDSKAKSVYSLNIKNCVKEDAGVYTVKISNNCGSAEETFKIGIQGIF